MTLRGWQRDIKLQRSAQLAGMLTGIAIGSSAEQDAPTTMYGPDRRFADLINVGSGSAATEVAEAIQPLTSAAPEKRTRIYRFFVSHSCSFDHRRRPETFRTAIATAFFCPTSTTNFLPRVTPV